MLVTEKRIVNYCILVLITITEVYLKLRGLIGVIKMRDYGKNDIHFQI